MTYTGPREWPVIWQQQPAGAGADWMQVLGEILPPMLGPLPVEQHPRVEIVTTTGSARLSRAEVVHLHHALGSWLLRTRWAGELPPAPEVDEIEIPGQLELPHGVDPSPVAERLAAETRGHVCRCRHTRGQHIGPECLGACVGTPGAFCPCLGFVLRSGFLP